MANDLASILRQYKVTDKSVWYKNKDVKRKVDVLMNKFRGVYFNYISNSVQQSWELSNNHTDNLITNYTNGITIPDNYQRKFYQRNAAAVQSFINRGKEGFRLSDRVWSLTNQTREQLETFISSGLTVGRPASKLALDLKQFLKEPERRFRRLRDPETGKLILSNPAKNYHPGRGVYRSSYKNALRLSRNEINIAYRTADNLRRQNLPFVLGIEVHLSNAHPAYDICDELQGDYPKNFNFIGWHPNCLCYSKSKLLSKEDFVKYLKGKEISQSKYVKSIPINAARYLNNNSERIKGLTNKPHFVAENFKNTKAGFSLKKNIGVDVKVPKLVENNMITNLKNSGVHVNFNETSLNDFNSKAKGFDLNTMFSSLETELQLNGISRIRKTVDFSNSGFNFSLSGRDFEMTREIKYKDDFNSVYHAYLRVPKSTQGKGLTKKMFQTLYKQYEAGNIKQINVTANIDVGGYAWAKYGFSATKKSEVLHIINKSQNEAFKQIAKRKANYHYKKYGNDKPFPMIRFANIEGGKKELLGTWWSGTIDLTNKKELEWFLNYLFQ
ncbi:hypothetical protein [Lutibacter maritimus]|nr:hypothetical protein [Lutibacter maritimus]